MNNEKFSVRRIRHTNGVTSFWIFTPDDNLHRPSQAVLANYRPSTQETYAYSLVDHLNWTRAQGKSPTDLTLEDLKRYMGAISNRTESIHGVAWRDPKKGPLSQSAAANVATIIRAYYRHLATSGEVNPDLLADLTPDTPVANDRRNRRGGHSNPLAPKKSPRRPRFLHDHVVESLFEPGVLRSARDIMIITWLHDGGLRVGGLCGLRFCDLHLVQNHQCGQRADPHVHIIGREDNPNGARAKAYGSYGGSVSEDGYVVDGVIRAVSPDMISTYYAYLLDDYHPVRGWVDHDQLLIHGSGVTPGAPLTTSGVRKMLRRACRRAKLDVRVTPHAFRHKAAAAFYAATDFNADMVAQEFGWAGPEIVSELYGRSANRNAMKYLRQAWDSTARPPSDPDLNTSKPTAPR